MVGMYEKHECLNSTKYLGEEKSVLHAVTLYLTVCVPHSGPKTHLCTLSIVLWYFKFNLPLAAGVISSVTYLLVYLHSGPCPPCPKMVTTTCFCKKAKPIPRRCSAKDWSCQQSCGRMLLCGQHKCENPCHKGIF